MCGKGQRSKGNSSPTLTADDVHPGASICRRLRCDIYQQEHGGVVNGPRVSFILSFVIVPPQTGAENESHGERADTLFPRSRM